MLTKDPAERAQLMILYDLVMPILASECSSHIGRGISVEEALSHPWLRELTEAAGSFDLVQSGRVLSAVLLLLWSRNVP